jgi:hypothetical protein
MGKEEDCFPLLEGQYRPSILNLSVIHHTNHTAVSPTVLICLFVYGLFSKAVGSSHYMKFNNKMIMD